MDLKRFVRDVPDFPKPGILFKDITPLLRDAAALRGSRSTSWRARAEGSASTRSPESSRAGSSSRRRSRCSSASG
jgi:hypothetical protein